MKHLGMFVLTMAVSLAQLPATARPVEAPKQLLIEFIGLMKSERQPTIKDFE